MKRKRNATRTMLQTIAKIKLAQGRRAVEQEKLLFPKKIVTGIVRFADYRLPIFGGMRNDANLSVTLNAWRPLLPLHILEVRSLIKGKIKQDIEAHYANQ